MEQQGTAVQTGATGDQVRDLKTGDDIIYDHFRHMEREKQRDYLKQTAREICDLSNALQIRIRRHNFMVHILEAQIKEGSCSST